MNLFVVPALYLVFARPQPEAQAYDTSFASPNTGHLGFHDLGRPFEKTLYRKDDPKRGQLK
jgi:hypothetical protein